jgi:hypothetical protein
VFLFPVTHGRDFETENLRFPAAVLWERVDSQEYQSSKMHVPPRQWQLTSRPTTQRFCELSNDAPGAAINKQFFRGGSRKPISEQKH